MLGIGSSSSSSSSSLSPPSTSSVPSSTSIPSISTTASISYTTITSYPATCDASRSAISSCASSCLSSAAVTQAGCGKDDGICQCQPASMNIITGAAANCFIGACGFGGAIDVLNSISACTFYLPLPSSDLQAGLLCRSCSTPKGFHSRPGLLSLISCSMQSAPASSGGCTPRRFRCSLRPRLRPRRRLRHQPFRRAKLDWSDHFFDLMRRRHITRRKSQH